MAAKSQIQYQREQSIALSHKLAKYLSPQVWQSIFTGERDVRLETQRKKLAVFFSDIRGFTELLNTYFTEMSQIALKYGGTIDKFVGDQRSFLEHEGDGFAMYLDSEKVSERERERIIQALDNAARRLRDE